MAAVKRRGKNGEYLHAMKYDFAKMQNMIESDNECELYNTLENIRSLKCKDVIKAIKNCAKYGNDNRHGWIAIYYTGHGQEKTGNWCFSDGVINLKQVLNAIFTSWGKIGITLYLDCCYSGNWAMELQKYQNKEWSVEINAATFPGNVAYDLPNGGMFTSKISSLNNESVSKRLYWCNGSVQYDEYSLDFYRADRKIK